MTNADRTHPYRMTAETGARPLERSLQSDPFGSIDWQGAWSFATPFAYLSPRTSELLIHFRCDTNADCLGAGFEGQRSGEDRGRGGADRGVLHRGVLGRERARGTAGLRHVTSKVVRHRGAL